MATLASRSRARSWRRGTSPRAASGEVPPDGRGVAPEVGATSASGATPGSGATSETGAVAEAITTSASCTVARGITALQAIGWRQRAVLALLLREDLTGEQVADLLGTTPGAVDALVDRALTALAPVSGHGPERGHGPEHGPEHGPGRGSGRGHRGGPSGGRRRGTPPRELDALLASALRGEPRSRVSVDTAVARGGMARGRRRLQGVVALVAVTGIAVPAVLLAVRGWPVTSAGTDPSVRAAEGRAFSPTADLGMRAPQAVVQGIRNGSGGLVVVAPGADGLRFDDQRWLDVPLAGGGTVSVQFLVEVPCGPEDTCLVHPDRRPEGFDARVNVSPPVGYRVEQKGGTVVMVLGVTGAGPPLANAGPDQLVALGGEIWRSVIQAGQISALDD